MPRLALTGLILYFLLAFGMRTYMHYRATGSTGFQGIDGSVGSLGWFGGVLFVAALVAAGLSPIAVLLGVLVPFAPLDVRAAQITGVIFCVIGAACTLWSQTAMGRSWRIGVDAGERTALIGEGPFLYVRNPIFSSMVLSLVGFALLTPHVLALIAIVALLTALQLQVRVVEEPYLRRVHGRNYARYAANTGRFLPRIGRLKSIEALDPDTN